MKSTNKLKNKFILNCSTQDYLNIPALLNLEYRYPELKVVNGDTVEMMSHVTT